MRDWPTPTKANADQGPSTTFARGNPTLPNAVVNWPTPVASLADKAVRSVEGAQVEVERGRGPDLGAVALANWPTPTETDSSSSARMTCERAEAWASHAGTTLTDAARLTEAGLPINQPAPKLAGAGSLNPSWVECLQGFPIGWTDLTTYRTGPLWSREREKHPEIAVPDSNWKQLLLDNVDTGTASDMSDSWPGWPSRPGEPQHAWEPPRIAPNVQNRPSRLRALGNAVVPYCSEFVGYRLFELVMTLTGSVSFDYVPTVAG